MFLFLKHALWVSGLVNVFIVEIVNQNKKEKSESNATLKNQGIMSWRIWDSDLQGLHTPMLWLLKWEIPATGYD